MVLASLAYSPPTKGAPSLAGPGVSVCSTSRPTLPEVGTWEGFEEGGKKGKDCFRDSMARALVYCVLCGTMSVGDGSGPVLGPRGECFGGVDTEVNKMRWRCRWALPAGWHGTTALGTWTEKGTWIGVEACFCWRGRG